MFLKLFRGCWVACALLLCGGCAEKVEMVKDDAKGGVQKADEDKVRGYLDAAGIKGEIVRLAEDGDAWIVDVGAPKPKDGKRPTPMPPNSYRIDKASGKILAGGT